MVKKNPSSARTSATAPPREQKRAPCAENGENVGNDNMHMCSIRRSCRERSSVERYVPTLQSKRTEQHQQGARFHVTPMNEWQWLVKKMNCCVRNTLDWRRGHPLPRPLAPCWLLPCKDDTAVEIAQHRTELQGLGWKLLTCEPHVVARIGNKANLHAYATELGLLEHLPLHYSTPQTASYPCMLKAAVGEHGRDVFIVDSADDVAQKAAGDFESERWLLQELCAGNTEYATSLLVVDGDIIDAICTSYVYDKEVYVWPYVQEARAASLLSREGRRTHFPTRCCTPCSAHAGPHKATIFKRRSRSTP
jgi:hypothetical protein